MLSLLTLEHTGLEPVTPTLPVLCAPNCANAPAKEKAVSLAPSGTRTLDPLIKSQLLYQLLPTELKVHKETAFPLSSPNWTRTSDTLINSQVLYRLSYGGIPMRLVFN